MPFTYTNRSGVVCGPPWSPEEWWPEYFYSYDGLWFWAV